MTNQPTFVARIISKNGNPISGVTVQARDIFDAQYKLQRQYPGCTIIEMYQRK
jgi:hypothetical protein